MAEIDDEATTHAKVTIDEPEEGWSRAYYDERIAAYVAERGAPPKTATLHPETLAALGFAPDGSDAGELTEGTVFVSSSQYPREVITLYE